MSDQVETKNEDEGAPATKRDVKLLGAELRGEMAAQEKRLLLEFGRMANSIMEHVSKEIGVIIDRLDGQHQQLRTEFDAHRKDFSLHKRPRSVAPKRATRRKPS